MLSYTKFIGDTSVSMELLIVDSSGVPVTGQTPFIKIRRQLDNFYLDFNDGTFKNSGWTSPTHVLNEIGATYSPGLYQLIWDSSIIITSEGNYAVEYFPNIVNYSQDIDYLYFVNRPMDLNSTIDGITLENIFEILMAMANGYFVKDFPTTGDITFYKRNNSTVLFTVHVSTSERTRL
jgi:hypothetical protein